MKYLSILSVLLLIGGNFSSAMESTNSTQQPNEITLQQKIKNIKENSNTIEVQNDINKTKTRIRQIEKRHGRGRLKTKQPEQQYDNIVTINVDMEDQKIEPNMKLKQETNFDKVNIIKGKTILKKKKKEENKICEEDEFCDSYDKKSTKSSLGEGSSSNLPIFHNKNELKGKSLKDGVIISHNDDMYEDINDEELGKNYYDREKTYKHPKFKTIDEIENSNIKDSFILYEDEEF